MFGPAVILQLTSQHCISGGAAAPAFGAINNNFEPTALYPLLESQRSPAPERENGESGSRGDRTTMNDSGGGPQFQEQV